MIPHFFADFGDFQILQPQNTKDLDTSRPLNGTAGIAQLWVSANPAWGDTRLYLNGHSRTGRNQILINTNKTYKTTVLKFVELLKHGEE